ncbi:MAG: indolepyruvate oxidoreductase subunit beta [Myxococcota bacterium]
MNFDLVLAGVGGQGVLSMAYVVDHAAVDAGFHLKQPEVHGMAQRGGAISAFVRMSDRPVLSDIISEGQAKAVLSVEPLEALRYTKLLAPDGVVVTDVTPLVNMASYPNPAALFEVLFQLPKLVAVDATKLALKAGAMKAQNMVVLGAASSHLPLPVESLEKHVEGLFAPKGERLVKANLAAFRMGRAAGAMTSELLKRGVPQATAARVVPRLSFEPATVADPVVAAWAERLRQPDGAKVAGQVFASRDMLPLEVSVPAQLK